jgi:hypothetical protein
MSNSTTSFRSKDLRVMSPARFPCATVLLFIRLVWDVRTVVCCIIWLSLGCGEWCDVRWGGLLLWWVIFVGRWMYSAVVRRVEATFTAPQIRLVDCLFAMGKEVKRVRGWSILVHCSCYTVDRRWKIKLQVHPVNIINVMLYHRKIPTNLYPMWIQEAQNTLFFQAHCPSLPLAPSHWSHINHHQLYHTPLQSSSTPRPSPSSYFTSGHQIPDDVVPDVSIH